MGAATSSALGFDAEGVLLDILEGGSSVACSGGDGGDGGVAAAAAAALVSAAERGDWADVSAQLAAGAPATARLGGEQRTALHYAAAAGQPDVVAALLRAGADAGARCAGVAALTPLHAAADAPLAAGADDALQQRATLAAVVALLCAAGAPCDVADGEFLQAPLHLAAKRGHAGVVEELLRAGARAHGEDRFGDTPADLAEDAGWGDLAAALRAR